MHLKKLPFKILKIIHEYNLIKPHDRIIIGVSGGADSVALLKVLHTINTENNLFLHLIVAHLNHQLRGNSSEEDARFVQKLTTDLELPFIQKNIDIQKISQKNKCSIEETARTERYRFFLESAQNHNATTVVVAHTADDNAETMLHRILRGTGILGLEGIPIKRPLQTNTLVSLIRPLLFTWRSEVLEYLESEYLDYKTDTSNYETTYLRNRIRLELLPLLETQYNPNIKNVLLQLAQILQSNNEYLRRITNDVLKDSTVECAENSYSLNTHFLAKQPRIIQYLVIQNILQLMQIPLKKITYRHYAKICEEITKKGKARTIQFPEKLYLWHERGILYLKKAYTPELDSASFSEITIQIPGKTPLHNLGTIETEVLNEQEISLEVFKKKKTKYEEILDLQSIEMPVVARGKTSGDIIFPLGSRGHKKIKDIFIDNKIPLHERDKIPIITMNGYPIWVIGFCIDENVKITPHTKKILKLTFQTHPISS